MTVEMALNKLIAMLNKKKSGNSEIDKMDFFLACSFYNYIYYMYNCHAKLDLRAAAVYGAR